MTGKLLVSLFWIRHELSVLSRLGRLKSQKHMVLVVMLLLKGAEHSCPEELSDCH